MRRKSFRRLRISLRHRWIAGESISCTSHPFVLTAGFSSSRSAFSVSTSYTQPQSRDQRATFSPQRPKFQSQTQFCSHFFFFFFLSKIKLLLRLRTRTTTRKTRLCLSSLFPPTRALLRFKRACFSLSNVRGTRTLVPLLKIGAHKKKCLGYIQNPKLASREKKTRVDRETFSFLLQSIFSSSSASSSTTCRQHQRLLYSTATTTTTAVAFTRLVLLGLRFRNKDEARRPRTLALRVLRVPLFLSKEEEGLRLYRGRVAVVMLLLLLLLARERRILRTTASTPTLA